MQYLLPSALLLLCLPLFGQLGLHAAYLNAEPEQWQEDASESVVQLPGAGWQVGADYRFRLRAARIEFLPSLVYQQRTADFGLQPAVVSSRVQSVGFYFPANFYVLDLQGDCDCPTFSKQGPALQKGLYLQISPGLTYFSYDLSDEFTQLTTEDLNINVGLALGLDIGLSDLLTLSPFVGVRYYPSLEWESLGAPAAVAFQFPERLQPTTDMLEYQVGLRVGFSWN